MMIVVEKENLHTILERYIEEDGQRTSKVSLIRLILGTI